MELQLRVEPTSTTCSDTTAPASVNTTTGSTTSSTADLAAASTPATGVEGDVVQSLTGASADPVLRTPQTVLSQDLACQRAGEVLAFLEALWGDDLPPGPDSVLTVMTDAVAIDDRLGHDRDLVVRGDGLTLQMLMDLLGDTPPAVRWGLLPEGLRARLQRQQSIPQEIAAPCVTRVVDIS